MLVLIPVYALCCALRAKVCSEKRPVSSLMAGQPRVFGKLMAVGQYRPICLSRSMSPEQLCTLSLCWNAVLCVCRAVAYIPSRRLISNARPARPPLTRSNDYAQLDAEVIHLHTSSRSQSPVTLHYCLERFKVGIMRYQGSLAVVVASMFTQTLAQSISQALAPQATNTYPSPWQVPSTSTGNAICSNGGSPVGTPGGQYEDGYGTGWVSDIRVHSYLGSC